MISGRYILSPEISGMLEERVGAGGEIQLTDGMVGARQRIAFHGVRFDGTYNCGSKLGFLDRQRPQPSLSIGPIWSRLCAPKSPGLPAAAGQRAWR